MSRTSGVVGTKLIDKLINDEVITTADIDEVYNPRLHATKEELYKACQSFMTEHHIYLLQMIRRDTESNEQLIWELTSRIKAMLTPCDNVLELLKQVSGIDTKSVEDLVAEIGLDMSVFPTEKYLASWTGVAPGNNESAGKKSSRTPHGNKQAKAAITEIAWAATRTKNTFYSARYHRLAARRGSK